MGEADEADEAGPADGPQPGAGSAHPDPRPTAAPPRTWLPADDGTGPYAGGPFAGVPGWRPEPRDPWAILWTSASSILTTSMVSLDALFGFLSPIYCDSCNDAELHRFGLYFWGYCGALLLPVILLIVGSALPPHKRYATARIVFGASALVFSIVIPLLYYGLLGTLH